MEVSASQLIPKIANYLNYITRQNDIKSSPHQLSRFHAKTIPSIDLQSYLGRILKYAPCSAECFLAMIIYLESVCSGRLLCEDSVGQNISDVESRLANTHIQSQAKIVLTSYNIHRLIVTATMISIKFLSDVFYTNLHFSRVGGIPVQELNLLELDFLKMCDFSLMITAEELKCCLSSVTDFAGLNSSAPINLFTIRNHERNNQHQEVLTCPVASSVQANDATPENGAVQKLNPSTQEVEPQGSNLSFLADPSNVDNCYLLNNLSTRYPVNIEHPHFKYFSKMSRIRYCVEGNIITTGRVDFESQIVSKTIQKVYCSAKPLQTRNLVQKLTRRFKHFSYFRINCKRKPLRRKCICSKCSKCKKK
jgi:hypothetical protein